jgi:hypothetical protein
MNGIINLGFLKLGIKQVNLKAIRNEYGVMVMILLDHF